MVNAPAIMKGRYEFVKSSGYEKILKIESEFDRALDADSRNRERSYVNWRAYFGVDGGQWPTKILQQLNDEDRHAASFNIIQSKVDTLAGSLASEIYDADWIPIEGSRNSLTEGLKDSYYADSELCEYDKHMSDVIRDAMIYCGDLKMVMSKDHNPLRNIAYKRVTPGFLVRDPYWISLDDKDCMRAWEIFHLSAIEIRDKYGIRNPRIDAEIRNWQRMGGEYPLEEYDSFDYRHRIRLHSRGHLFRVIEYHWMEPVQTTRLMGKKINSQRWIPFPITNQKEKLEAYMIKNKIDPTTLAEHPYEDKIHHVTTICPTLTQTELLEDGISVVQPKRLPYFHFTANRAMGVDKGIVDDIIDIQETINRRESKLTDMIGTATGGGKLVNKDLFKTAEQRRRFEKEANNPGYIEFVEGEELSKERSIHYLNSNQFPSTLINQLERMWDIVDRVSKVPAAMDAMSESANESGILFERKLQVSRMGLMTISNNLKNFRHSLAEAYYEQWQLAYNGPEREFATRDGRHRVTLNRRVFNADDGRLYIENRPDQIPRCHVVVTESKNSPNRMLSNRAIYSDLYNLSAQANPQSPYTSFFYRRLLETMPLSDSDKAELESISFFEKIKDRKRMEAEIANLDATSKQAALMGLQAMMQIENMGRGQEVLPAAQIPEEDIPQQASPGEVPVLEGEITGGPPATQSSLPPTGRTKESTLI